MGTDQLPYQCFLTIRNRYKGIPYGGGTRDGSSINHGFKPLKAAENPATSVPEAHDDPPLTQAINAVNAPQTSFFTVGCEKSLNPQADGKYWKRGYLEIAFNDTALCNDSRNYFALFQEFSAHLHKTGFRSSLAIEWELEAAHFIAANIGGWTVTVWITTALVNTVAEAEQLWAVGLATLVEFLVTQSFPVAQPIYGGS